VKQSNDLEIWPRSSKWRGFVRAVNSLYHIILAKWFVLFWVCHRRCCITWKLSSGHVCKSFGRQWTKEAKIAIFSYYSHLMPPPQGTPANICINLILPETTFPVHCIFVAIWVALQIFEQFCPKAGDAKPLVAEPETFKVIQGHLFRYYWRVTNGLHSTI